MKLIESSAEFISQEDGLQGIYKQIERAGRICYKSEDKITDNSAKEFVDKMISSGHLAMLEHGTVYLTFKDKWFPNDKNIFLAFRYKYESQPYNHIVRQTKMMTGDDGHNVYVTSNYRILFEHHCLEDMDEYLLKTFYHERRYAFKLVTSIGIVRELLRHRVFSFANESTRYCNYSKNKFDNELTFILPAWVDRNREPNNYGDDTFLEICSRAEFYYTDLIKQGYTAQQAREVLPLCTKSELIMTGFESDWKHFFDLRLFGKTGKPHPDMVILCEKIKNECIKNNIMTNIFNEQ